MRQSEAERAAEAHASALGTLDTALVAARKGAGETAAALDAMTGAQRLRLGDDLRAGLAETAEAMETQFDAIRSAYHGFRVDFFYVNGGLDLDEVASFDGLFDALEQTGDVDAFREAVERLATRVGGDLGQALRDTAAETSGIARDFETLRDRSALAQAELARLNGTATPAHLALLAKAARDAGQGIADAGAAASGLAALDGDLASFVTRAAGASDAAPAMRDLATAMREVQAVALTMQAVELFAEGVLDQGQFDAIYASLQRFIALGPDAFAKTGSAAAKAADKTRDQVDELTRAVVAQRAMTAAVARGGAAEHAAALEAKVAAEIAKAGLKATDARAGAIRDLVVELDDLVRAEEAARRLRDDGRSLERLEVEMALIDEGAAIRDRELALLDRRNLLLDAGYRLTDQSVAAELDGVIAIQDARKRLDALSTSRNAAAGIARLERERALVWETAEARELELALYDKRVALQERGVDLASRQAQAELDAVRTTLALSQDLARQEQLRDLSEGMAEDLARALQTGMTSGWRNGLADMWSMFGRWLEDLQIQLLTRPLTILTNAVVNGVHGGLTGGMGGGVGGLGLGDLLGVGSTLWSGMTGGTGYGQAFVNGAIGRSLGLSTPGITGAQAQALGVMPVPGGVSALGNTVAAGINAAPWGIVGSLGASVLGFQGTGNALGDLALSTGASIGGGMLGSTLLGGAFGGPIGAVLGGFAAPVVGDLLGGLFGDDPPVPYAMSQWRPGQGITRSFSLDGGDNSATDALAAGVGESLYGLISAGGGKSGYGVSARDRQGEGYISFAKKKYDLDTEPLEIFKAAVKAGAISGLNADAKTVALNYDAPSEEKMAEALEFAKGFSAILAEPAKELPAYVQAAHDLRDTYQASAKSAREYGLATDDLTNRYLDRRADLKARFDDEIASNLQGLVDPVGAALADLGSTARELRQSAKATGGDMKAVNAYIAAMKADILSEKRAFDGDIRSRVLGIVDPYKATTYAVEQMQDELLERARETRGSVSQVNKLIALEYKKLKETRDAYNKSLLQQIHEYTDPGKAAVLEWEIWADQLRAEAEAAGVMETSTGRRRVQQLIDLRYQEITAIDGTTASIAALKEQADSLQDWVNSTILGENSSLTAEQKLAAAQGQFEDELAAARKTGGQDADISALTSAATALLSATSDYYGGTAGAAFLSMETWLYGTLKGLANQWGMDIDIPKFATGGHHLGGWRVVGERGPEIEFTGSAKYLTAAQSAEVLRPRAANDRGASVSEMRRVSAAIERGNALLGTVVRVIAASGEQSAALQGAANAALEAMAAYTKLEAFAS